MEFTINNLQKSINDIMRQIGYIPAYFQNNGEFSIIKKIGKNDYPRFHLYIIPNDSEMIFKLHLDQKKPSYKGAKGHSGDYDGNAVEEEAERIKRILNI